MKCTLSYLLIDNCVYSYCTLLWVYILLLITVLRYEWVYLSSKVKLKLYFLTVKPIAMFLLFDGYRKIYVLALGNLRNTVNSTVANIVVSLIWHAGWNIINTFSVRTLRHFHLKQGTPCDWNISTVCVSIVTWSSCLVKGSVFRLKCCVTTSELGTSYHFLSGNFPNVLKVSIILL